MKNRLTQHQLEIASLIAQGYSNKQIGHRLIISEATVKNLVSYIMKKLEVSNRTQIVTKLIGWGWLDYDGSIVGSSDIGKRFSCDLNHLVNQIAAIGEGR